MTAPVPVPDGTTPPAEAVEAAMKAIRDHRPSNGMRVAMGATCVCGYWTGSEPQGPLPSGHHFLINHVTREVAAAVVAALDLPAREREAAAPLMVAAMLTVQDVRAQRGDHIAGLVEDSFAAHFARASALREGRQP